MTNEEFFKACETFDWYYNFSDDSRVYDAGDRRRFELMLEASTDPVKKQMLADWSGHMFSGEAFGTLKLPKPEWENY